MKSTRAWLSHWTALCLLGLATQALAGETPVVEYGGKQLKLPPPTGFVNVAQAGPKAAEAVKNFKAGPNERLMLLMRESDVEALNAGMTPLLKRFADIQAPKGRAEQSVNGEMFAFMTSIVKQQVLGNQKTLDTLIKKGFEENRERRAANKTDEVAREIALGETRPLAILREDDRAFSAVLMMKMNVDANGAPIAIPMVTTLNLLRLQGKIVYAYLLSFYQDESDLEWLKTTTVDWVDRLTAANP